MKITQKDFNKLNQLDRIEYRQIRDNIENRLQFVSISTLYSLLFMIGFVAILGIAFYQISPEAGQRLILLIPNLFLLTVKILIVTVIIDLFILVLYAKENKKLRERFFKFEVKVKNYKGGKK